jgi:hypothetical protein
VKGITAVLGTFQEVFTTVYNAIVNGPKQTSKVSAEIAVASSFGFAFTFPGSVGVMMTLPNDRLLVGETDLDQAMSKTLQLLTADDSDEIQELTRVVGVPAVRKAYEWAHVNSAAGFGADIVWRRGETGIMEVRVQAPEVAAVAMAMRAAVAEEQVVLVGELMDVNMFDRTFQMSVDGRTIHGQFDKAIRAGSPAELPKRYRAIMKISTRVVVGEGQEERTYFLVRLEPVDEAPEDDLPGLPSR